MKRLAILAAALLPSIAFAQSVPYGPITAGTTYSVSQWNGAWSSKVDVNNGSLVSPTITGTPTAPTAAPGTNTTQLATTAFVNAAGGAFVPLAGGTMTGPLHLGTNTIDGSAIAFTGGSLIGPITFNTTNAAGYLQNGSTILTQGTTANNPVLFVGKGAGALANLSTFNWVVGVGPSSLANWNNVGGEISAFGSLSCYQLQAGNGDVCLGLHSLGNETNVSNSSAVGNDAMRNTVGANSSSAFGESAGRNSMGSFNVYVGANTGHGNASSLLIGGTPTTGDVITIAISGSPSGVTGLPASASYTVKSGDTLSSIAAGVDNAINAISPKITGQGVNLFAFLSLQPNGPPVVGLDFPGNHTVGWALTFTPSISGAATETVTVGNGTSGGLNVVVGQNSFYGAGSTSSQNLSLVGADVVPFATTAGEGDAIGASAGYNVTSDTSFDLSGFQAGYSMSGTYGNDLHGNQAGYGITSGNSNTVVGDAGNGNGSTNCITTGSSNLELGAGACVQSATSNFQISIENLIYGANASGSGSSVSPGSVGIGQKSPGARLDVLGTDTSSTTGLFKLENSTPSTVMQAFDNGGIVIGAPTGGTPGAGTINAQGLQINGVAVDGVLSGTTGSIGGSALAVGACASGTVTITGATTGMAIVATPVTYPGAGFDWNRSYVSAANTVTVQVCADVAGTPTASAYNVRVLN